MKIITFLLILASLGLNACGNPNIGLNYIYEGDGYYGDDLAGRNFAVTEVEIGIGSGNFYQVDPINLELSFDVFAESISGRKNCNWFDADINWFNFGLVIDVYSFANQFCGADVFEFPENIFLSDAFELELAYELGRQILILYSDSQNVAIYFRETRNF